MGRRFGDLPLYLLLCGVALSPLLILRRRRSLAPGGGPLSHPDYCILVVEFCGACIEPKRHNVWVLYGDICSKCGVDADWMVEAPGVAVEAFNLDGIHGGRVPSSSIY